MVICSPNVSPPVMATEQAIGVFGGSSPGLRSSFVPAAVVTQALNSSCQFPPRTRSLTHWSAGGRSQNGVFALVVAALWLQHCCRSPGEPTENGEPAPE